MLEFVMKNYVLTIRAKSILKLKTGVMNSDFTFSKGACLIGVICDLITYTGMDVSKARTKINKALDDKEAAANE